MCESIGLPHCMYLFIISILNKAPQIQKLNYHFTFRNLKEVFSHCWETRISWKYEKTCYLARVRYLQFVVCNILTGSIIAEIMSYLKCWNWRRILNIWFLLIFSWIKSSTEFCILGQHQARLLRCLDSKEIKLQSSIWGICTSFRSVF